MFKIIFTVSNVHRLVVRKLGDTIVVGRLVA